MKRNILREYLNERNKIAYTTQDGSVLLVKGSRETMLELNTVEKLVSTTLPVG
jgi:hypothetical protein